MTTSYTYKPLIGVKSITARNGQTKYYNYDKAERLQSIIKWSKWCSKNIWVQLQTTLKLTCYAAIL